MGVIKKEPDFGGCSSIHAMFNLGCVGNKQLEVTRIQMWTEVPELTVVWCVNKNVYIEILVGVAQLVGLSSPTPRMCKLLLNEYWLKL